MSKREPKILLDDIQLAIAKIERYTAGLDRAAFLGDEKTIDAVVRNLEIIGEAVRQLPNEWKDRHPAVVWSQIAGMRNRIVHDYMAVDLEIVWNILQKSLPDFRSKLAGIAP